MEQERDQTRDTAREAELDPGDEGAVVGRARRRWLWVAAIVVLVSVAIVVAFDVVTASPRLCAAIATARASEMVGSAA